MKKYCMSTSWKDMEQIYNFCVGGLHKFYFKNSLKQPGIGSAPTMKLTTHTAASKIDNSQNIQPKFVNKYSLERY
jgi:hypothetical protein